jgi:hypothetical protein
LLKELLKSTPLYWHLRSPYVRMVQQRELRAWHKRGCPVPPPHVIKQQTIKHYAEDYKLDLFVETGTCLGDMVEAVKRDFERVYSIEVDEELFQRARHRFRKDRHVVVMQGNSARLLKHVVKQIDRSTLFWLDAHYSGGVTAKGKTDTPILEELECLFDAADLRHVIIIDDARCFGNDRGYPTIEKLTTFVTSWKPLLDVSVKNDMIIITPPGTTTPK